MTKDTVTAEDLAADLDLGEVLALIKSLRKGPRGRQNQRGFTIVEDHPDHDAITLVPVFAVLCKDDEKEDPQYRILSTHELLPTDGSDPMIEIRDRIMVGRVARPEDPVANLIAGGADDFGEVAGKSGLRWGLGKGLKAIAGLLGFMGNLPDLLNGAVGKLEAKLE